MAGLIPQPFIDDLLDRVDIVEVIDRRVKLKKAGKNYQARCPFHDEKTPSFSVNPEKQFYYCFGCSAGGNALSFVMDYENLDFPGAVESLASSVGMQVPREEKPNPAAQGQRELYTVLERAAEFYQQQLRSHPQRSEAVDYLKGRGLTGAIAKEYGLGYAPPGWDNLMQAYGADEIGKKRLLQTGMLVENEAGRCYDRFRQRIVFPIRDPRGRVIAFGGRVLGDDKPKYLNSPETPVFNKGRELYGLYEARKAVRNLERLVIVEGYMDVIALAQSGIPNAVATLGTATSTTHLEKVYRLCPEVVFCFDGDNAGRKAAARALESALPAMEDGRQARFLFLPDGEDPDTLVRAQGNEHFLQLIAEAMPLEQFLFTHLGEGLQLESLDGRARLSKLAAPMIGKIPPGVYRELMLQELARRTGLETATLTEAMRSEPEPEPEAAPAKAAPAGPKQRRPLPQTPRLQGTPLESAIALLLHKPEIASQVEDPELLRKLDEPDAHLLFELVELLQRRPDSNTAMVLGHWHSTPQGERLIQLASQERLIPSDGVENEFIDIIKLLNLKPKDRDFAAVVDKLREKNFSDITDQEKQELLRELEEKRRQDRSRGK